MRVLFILSQQPYPWWLYGRSSYYYTLLSLSKFIDVHVSFPVSSIKEGDIIPLRQKNINPYPYVLDTKDKYYKLLLNLFEKEPFKIRKYWNINYRNFLIQITKEIKPDIIQVHTPHMALYGMELKKIFPEIPIILRPQDIVSQQIETLLNNSKNPFLNLIASWQLKKTIKYETYVWNFYDKVVFLTKPNLQYAKILCTQNNLLNCDNEGKFLYIMDGVDVKENLYIKNKNKEDSIAFAASDQIQNVLSLKWFLNNIWFKIYSETKFKLNIYGKICEHFKQEENILREKKVYLNGFIENKDKLDLELSKSKLFISPTIAGSGYRTKILDAGSIGMPVLCTSFDLEPFTDFLKPNQHILVADTKDEFLEILKKIEYNEISLEKISYNFYVVLKQEFSWDNTAKKFLTLYSNLKNTSLQIKDK